MSKNIVIVTRHAGAVEWLRRRGIQGEIKPMVGVEDVRGKIVIGNVPVRLAHMAKEVWAFVMNTSLLPPFLKGKDLTADQMEQAKARLIKLKVEYLGEVTEDDING